MESKSYTRAYSKFTTFVLVASLFILPVSAYADALNIDGIIAQGGAGVNLSVLAGTADLQAGSFSSGGSTYGYRLLLSNTSSAATGGDSATNLLTGIGFSLPTGVSISGGTVLSGSSTLINISGGSLSEFWGYDTSPLNSGPFKDPAINTFGSVNTAIATLSAAVDPGSVPGSAQSFAGNVSNGTIDGPGYGLLSDAVGAGVAGGLPAIQDTIAILFNLEGTYGGNLFDFINGGNVILAFGSPTVPVPEAGTMMLLGSGLIVVATWGRKRYFKA